MNAYVYNWDAVNQRPVRKSIEEAKQLLAEGRLPRWTGQSGKPARRYL